MKGGMPCISDSHLYSYATSDISHSIQMTVWYAGRNALHTRQSSI